MATTVFELMAKLGLDSSAYEQGLDNAKSMGSTLGGGLATAAKVGMAAVGAATTATVAFGKSAVDAGMTFDKSMSQVFATMGDKADAIVQSGEYAGKKSSEALRDFAQEMGRTTAFSASQSADALNYMALAGYDAQTSMQMLPNVLNLAAAGNFDLARASDMVTDTQTAFGISLDRTAQMVDEMAKASSTGNTSVEQLGDAFLTVGGLAQELNGGMVTLADGTQKPVDGVQELEIALTAMANAGVKGNEAGTHMRNMLLKLSSPTSDGAKQLEALGVSVFDAEGNMRSLSDVFGDLNGALSNLTQEEKIQAIGDLFNTRDLASAEALLNAVGQDWDEIGAAILDSEGAAQKMADTQLDNLAGDMTLFKSALEGAKIAVSDSLTPSLREFVQFGTDGLSRLTGAFKEGGLTGAMEEFGDILAEGLNMIIEKLPQFVDAGMKLLGALGQGILDNLPAITEAAGKVIVMLIEGIVQSLPSLVEGAIQIIGQLATFLGEQLPTLIPAIVDMLLSIVDAIIDNIDILIDGAIALVTGLAEGIAKALPKLIAKIPELIIKLTDAIAENAPKIAEAAPKIMIELAAGLIKSVPELIKAIPQIIVALGKALTSTITMYKDIGKSMWKLISDGFKDGPKETDSEAEATVKEFFNSIGEVASERINEFSQAIDDFFSPIIDGITEWWDGLTSTLEEYTSLLVESMSEWWAEITQPIVDAWNSVMEVLQPLFDAFSNLISTVWEAIKILTQRAWEEISTWLSEKWTAIVESVTEFFQPIFDKVSEIWEAIKAKTEEVWNAVKEFFEGIWNGIVEFFTPIIEGIRDKVSEVWENIYTSVSDWMTQVHDNLASAWEGISTLISDTLSGIWDAITGFFTELIDSALEWGRDLIGNFIDGIKENIGNLSNTMNDMAQGVRDYVHFSEPDKGPLADFHTYAPDMMQLFAKGIKDNEGIVEKQLNDSLDFSSSIATVPNLPTIDTSRLIPTSGSTGTSGTGTAILEIDHVQFAKLIYNLYNNEDQRMGVRLANA